MSPYFWTVNRDKNTRKWLRSSASLAPLLKWCEDCLILSQRTSEKSIHYFHMSTLYNLLATTTTAFILIMLYIIILILLRKRRTILKHLKYSTKTVSFTIKQYVPK